MKRSEAREILFQMLFEMEARKEFSEAILKSFEEEHLGDSEQKEYFEKTFASFVANKEAVDDLIESSSEKWHIKQMGKTDLAVLRLAVTEAKFPGVSDVPENVAISEAVKIAKKFGSEDSGKFVNGVLGKISRS